MNKYFPHPVLLILACLSVTPFVRAERYGDLVYEIHNNGVKIVDYSIHAKGDLVIPATIEGLPVIEIGEAAFQSRTLNRITLPEGLKIIGDMAFAFTDLFEIYLPTSIETVSDRAFFNCRGLSWISIPPENAFYTTMDGRLYDKSVTELVLAPPARNIPDPFVIPETVVDIGNFAFAYAGFRDVILPTGLTTIGESAFLGAFIEKITIPASLTSIGELAFQSCSALNAFEVDADNSAYAAVDGVLFSKDLTRLILYPPAHEGTSYTIPPGVIEVADWAFTEARSLQTLSIPSSTKTFGDLSLKFDAVSFEVAPENENFMAINDVLFSKDGTELLLYPRERIGDSYQVPETVTKIGSGAFESCYNLLEVLLPSNLTAIEKEAFDNCRNLAEVVLPDGLETIGIGAFQGCRNLVDIAIPSTVSELGERAFAGCSDIESVAIPEQISVLNPGVFQGCRSLVSITLPSGMESIGEEAFNGCRSLSTIALPESLQEIGVGAFSGCQGLESLVIPESVIQAGDYAFYNCSSLTTLHLPKSLEFLGEQALVGCRGLKEIQVDADNSYYKSVDGVLFTADGSELIKYPVAKEAVSYQVPDGTVEIANRAFRVSILHEIILPDSLQTIESQAFELCRDLVSVEIPEGLLSIGSGAFEQCESLELISLPPRLESLEESVFQSCQSLTQITIPDSVRHIGDNAFNACYDLESVIFGDRIHFIGNRAFEFCIKLSDIDLPKDLLQMGQRAFAHCESLSHMRIPEGVTRIGEFGFYMCSALQSVRIPQTLNRIEESTFNSCTSLRSIRFSEGLTSIGVRAFENCWALPVVSFPSSLEDLGAIAFGSSINLTHIYFKGDAPVSTDEDPIENEVFAGINNSATVYYLDGAVGFTSPTWAGLPVVNLGQFQSAQAWLVENGLPHDTDLESIPENSHVPLLVSYSLAQEPGTPHGPDVAIEGNQLSYHFFGGREDVSYQVEISKDLAEWSNQGVIITEPDPEGLRTATLDLENGRCFVRFRFIRNS